MISPGFIAHVTSRVAHHPGGTDFIVKIFVGVSVSPQADFRVIQDELIHVRTVTTIGLIVRLIARMSALPARAVMTHHDHAVRMFALGPAIRDHFTDVVPHHMMILQGMLGQEFASTTCSTVCHSLEIMHDLSGMPQGQRILAVEVGPQGTADEQVIPNRY